MITDSLLAKLFDNISTLEKNVESARQSWAQQSQFDSYSSFNRIDKYKRGSISLSDLEDFLQANHIFPTST